MRSQLINNPENLVTEALEGLEMAYPKLIASNLEDRYVVRRRPAKNKVTLISGGGSGHEPLHAGFVGEGMLDAAVAGNVFSSPAAGQVVAAAKACDVSRGVLFIVKNYTGDILNFRIAAEELSDEGIQSEMVIVADDLASESGPGSLGRRGTGAAVIVEKVCGALAELGRPLDEVASTGRQLASRCSSLAMALSGAVHPTTGKESFALAAGEVEFGVGIHGERGIERRALREADEHVHDMIERLCADRQLSENSEVILLTNGLGASTQLELLVLHRAAVHELHRRGIQVARSLVGNYVTALNMAGFSFTLAEVDGSLLRLWDAPAVTPSWIGIGGRA